MYFKKNSTQFLEIGLLAILFITQTTAGMIPQSQNECGDTDPPPSVTPYLEYKRVTFNISTSSTTSFRVKNAEIFIGKWCKNSPCNDATEAEINSILIDHTRNGLFGARGMSWPSEELLLRGTYGFFHIGMEDGTNLAKVFFEVPYTWGSNTAHLTDISTLTGHKCEVVYQQIGRDDVITEIVCK